jgi:hypothetical protein
VIRLSFEREPPSPVRPDAGPDTDGRANVDEGTTLLNVQLDEDADPAQNLVVAAELRGVDTSTTHRLIERDAIDIGEGTGGVRP